MDDKKVIPVPVPEILPGKEPLVDGARITWEQLNALAEAIEHQRNFDDWLDAVRAANMSARRMDRALQWLRKRRVIFYQQAAPGRPARWVRCTTWS